MASAVSEVTNLLGRLEQLDARVREHNQRENEIRGFKKARIQGILAEVEKLKALGYNVELELVGETEFTQESVARLVEVSSSIVAEKEAEADYLEKFLSAVERKDYEAIKELTGQDVSEVNYDLELSDVKDLKKDVKELQADMLEKGLQGKEVATNPKPKGVSVGVEADPKEDVGEAPVEERKDEVEVNLDTLTDDDLDSFLEPTVEEEVGEVQEAPIANESVEESLTLASDDDDWGDDFF